MNSIRLRSPGDVVAVLPYQLGYHPRDSLVVVALRDRAVVLVERLDLPAPEDVDEACQMLVPPLLHEAPDAVLLVAYESQEGAGRPALGAIHRELAPSGLTVLDRIVVRDGRWYAVDCETGCCPPGGSPVPSAADTPAVAEFVGLGIAPLSGRAALADLVAADPDRTPAVANALARRADRRGGLGHVARQFEALSLWAVALGLRDAPGGAVPAGPTDGVRAPSRQTVAEVDRAVVEALRPDQVAVLIESLTDLPLRDALVAWLCPGSLPPDCLSPDVLDAVRTCLPAPGWSDGSRPGGQGDWGDRSGSGSRGARGGRRRNGDVSDGAERGARGVSRDGTVEGRRYLVRLQHLVRAVPDEHAAAPLTVLANLAWWLGDGALARTCLERALDSEPDYRLALLLERMLDLGIRPGSSMQDSDGVRAG